LGQSRIEVPDKVDERMSRRWFWLLSTAILLALTLGAYASVFQNGFVDFDDNVYVTNNAATARGLSVAGFYYAWTTLDSGNWIPVTWLSYQLDATLFGRSAWGYHLTNLLLHSLNVLLLFTWLNLVTAAPWRSVAVAALFAVHPLHVESVAWIAERKDVLSMFWLLVAMLTYTRYTASSSPDWYVATFIAFALGLLSKSMLVTFPVLLLLLDIWPLARLDVLRSPVSSLSSKSNVSWLLLEKLPFFAMSLLVGLVTIHAQSAGHAVGEQLAGNTLTHLSLPVTLGNALQAYAWYLTKTIWPTKLSVFYPHPLGNLDRIRIIVSLTLLTIVSLYVAFHARRRPYLLFGWLWFLIALLPVIGLLQVGSQAYADRYCYIPHLGLLLVIVWETDYWVAGKFRLSSATTSIGPDYPQGEPGTNDRETISPVVRSSQSIPLPHFLGFAIAAAAVSALSFQTVQQIAVWRSTDTLWNHALATDPENWFAHLQIGNGRLTAGNTDDETLRHFQVVLRHRPQHAIALNNVGWIYQCREEWHTAEDYYRESLTADSALEPAIHNLVVVLKKQNRLVEALGPMQAYVERRPNDAYIQNELGLVHARQGQLEAARVRFERATQASPDFANARYNLALALMNLGRNKEARTEFERLLNQYPNHPNAHLNLGILLEKMGQLTDARTHYAAAVQESPNDHEARDRLHALNKLIRSR
jgi:protein O-mannosyl-transferase